MKKVIFFFIFGMFFFSLVFAASEEIEVIITEKKVVDTKDIGSRGIKTSSGETIRKLDRMNDVEVIRKYSTFSGASIRVTREKFEELKKDERYNVREARIFHLSLDNSIPQIEADSVWNLPLGNNLVNGTGQTVCIIDTGVNYSHSAFGGCYGNNNASSDCTVIGGYDFNNDAGGGEDSNPMDEDGHGTHVAGIVASRNETYRGVAPGAKIIAIKVFNSTGGGWDTDIIAGIDWCVNNSATFNISVISMSLSDCTNWSTTCDSDSAYNDSWVPAINAAAALNITIVAAAGNGPTGGCGVGSGLGTTNGPAAPACLSNITPIGSVYSNDSVVDSIQRGVLFQLFAPGINICSTRLLSDSSGTNCGGGNFIIKSGTSMATPHVAGAAAIVNQMYKYQKNRLPSITEFRNLMNTTGFIINDTAGTNRNYSRINVSSAIFSIDETGPSVTLNSPTDDTESLESNQTFNCSFADFTLSNATFFVWNSTSHVYSNQTTNRSGNYNSSTFNLTNTAPGNYTWNCKAFDILGNYAFASSNYSFEIKNVIANLTSPLNNYQTSIEENDFSCQINTSTTKILSNVTFYLWNSSNISIYNSTQNISGTYNSSTFNYTFSSSANYTWNCFGINNRSESSFATTNYTLKYDGTAPSISNISSNPDTDSVTITWQTNELSNSTIYGGDLSGSSSSLVTSHSVVVSSLEAGTEYEYYIRSCDNVGNCVSSSQQEVTTDTESGGGGGGSSTTTSSTEEDNSEDTMEISLGENSTVEVGDELTFEISEEGHTIIIINITNTSLNLSIESEIIYISLNLNEEKKINLTSPEYFDLLIRLIEINEENATIYLEEINESISYGTMKNDGNVVGIGAAKNSKSFFGKVAIYLPRTVGIMIFLSLVYLIIKKRKKLKEGSHHKHSHERKKEKNKAKPKAE